MNNGENEDDKNGKGGWAWTLPDWVTLPEWPDDDYDYDYTKNDTDTCVDYGQNITGNDVLQHPIVNAVKVSPHAHNHDDCFHQLQKKMKYDFILFGLILAAGILACSIIAGILTIIIILVQLIIKTVIYVRTLFIVLKQATSAMW